MDGDGIALEAGTQDVEFRVHAVATDVLGHAEVDECHPSVGQQQIVAGLGIAGELPESIERAEEEAEDDLGEAVALFLTELQDLLEADAIDPLAHEYALARQLSHDIGNDDEGVSAPAARKAPLSLRLVLVVELLQGALANLGGDSARIQAGREPSHGTQ